MRVEKSVIRKKWYFYLGLLCWVLLVALWGVLFYGDDAPQSGSNVDEKRSVSLDISDVADHKVIVPEERPAVEKQRIIPSVKPVAVPRGKAPLLEYSQSRSVVPLAAHASFSHPFQAEVLSRGGGLQTAFVYSLKKSGTFVHGLSQTFYFDGQDAETDGGSRATFKILNAYHLPELGGDSSPMDMCLSLSWFVSDHFEFTGLSTMGLKGEMAQNLGATYSTDRGDRLFIQYNVANGMDESMVRTFMDVGLTNDLFLSGGISHSFTDQQFMDKSLKLSYRPGKWAVELSVVDNGEDDQVFLLFSF